MMCLASWHWKKGVSGSQLVGDLWGATGPQWHFQAMDGHPPGPSARCKRFPIQTAACGSRRDVSFLASHPHEHWLPSCMGPGEPRALLPCLAGNLGELGCMPLPVEGQGRRLRPMKTVLQLSLGFRIAGSSTGSEKQGV